MTAQPNSLPVIQQVVGYSICDQTRFNSGHKTNKQVPAE